MISEAKPMVFRIWKNSHFSLSDNLKIKYIDPD